MTKDKYLISNKNPNEKFQKNSPSKCDFDIWILTFCLKLEIRI